MAVTSVLRSPAPRRTATGLAIFDLDRTVIDGSSLAAFGRAAVAAGIVKRRVVVRHLLAELRFKHRGLRGETLSRLTERLLAAAAGKHLGDLLRVTRDVAPVIASRALPSAVAAIERHRHARDHVVLLSASPEPLVRAIGDELGVDSAIGTKLEIVGGRLSGRLDGPLCHGAGKLARLRDVFGDVDLRTCTAYADAESDLPLLRAVGVAVAVNADRRLAAAARAAGWERTRFD